MWVAVIVHGTVLDVGSCNCTRYSVLEVGSCHCTWYSIRGGGRHCTK